MEATVIAFRKSPVDSVLQKIGPLKTVEKMSKEALKVFAAENQDIQLEREGHGTAFYTQNWTARSVHLPH